MAELWETLPYWDDLTEKEKELVAKQAVVLHFKKGDVLYGPDVECVGQIHILKGRTRAYILSDEGREITLFRVEEGDNCILSASCVLAYITFDSFMVADRDTDLVSVPVKLYGDLCENNIRVRCFTYELATTRFSQVVYSMQDILFARLDRRLAAWLLQEHEKTGSLSIRITQEELAQQVNSVRETVGRLLKRFAEEGMIENRRGTIRLTDLYKLKATTE